MRKSKLKAGLLLVALGIVYGDIGTSPMYVMKSLVNDNGGINQIGEEFILGSLSLIIWTLTILTTVKYVLVAMRADNHGEGGIFALYSLVKRYARWLIIPAMIGGAALLADGILTPAVTVTTAVEGLRSIPAIDRLLGTSQQGIIVITLVIITLLFWIQRAGTSSIGTVFGPIMTIWFLFLGVSGLFQIQSDLSVFRALNPVWAVRLMFSPANHIGFMILGNVFLATTGAEALYSDMGHVGRSSIYMTWPFVKICLILNYLGQGAWLINNIGNQSLSVLEDMNPFFMMLPEWLRSISVILGTIAAIIASQALITGSFTLVSEAIRLDLMPHMQTFYPSKTKEQIYIPVVNTFIWIGCTLVVLYFQRSSRMEAAYGLAITLTMLVTTLLLAVYLIKIRKNIPGAIVFGLSFGLLESVFFFSSLSKLLRGGYVAAIIALLLLIIMVVWNKGTQVERQQSVKLKIREFMPQLKALHEDDQVQLTADNLVYITKIGNPEYVDRDILFSILNKGPKRAAAYWLVNINVTESPFTRSYHIENYGTDYLFHVKLYLGFKTHQRINVVLRQAVGQMIENGELPAQIRKYSIYSSASVGNFIFCIIHKTLNPESDIPESSRNAIYLKYAIRSLAGSPVRWYGLENSRLLVEHVPLFIEAKETEPFVRIR